MSDPNTGSDPTGQDPVEEDIADEAQPKGDPDPEEGIRVDPLIGANPELTAEHEAHGPRNLPH